jgi:arabinose-5-phosphate isomerase
MSRQIARDVLYTEADAIRALAERLDERFDEAVETILSSTGRLVISGMGKSGIVCKKIAATFSSTGTPSLFLHPAEALHGDLGMVVSGDVVLLVSSSGTTTELLRLLEYLKRINVTIISFVGDRSSALGTLADISIDVGVSREACLMNLAPTASSTAALAMGDALAVAVYTKRSFKADDFARMHPGGQLGFKLVKVKDVMHQAEAMPCVLPDVSVQEAIAEISKKRMGMTTVVDQTGCLLGLLTDGDLRRLLEAGHDLAKTSVGEHATKSPVLVAEDQPASKALQLMEQRRIAHLLVTDAERKLIGVVHIQDLWRLQMF